MIERFYETFQSMIIYFEPVDGIHNKVQHREISLNWDELEIPPISENYNLITILKRLIERSPHEIDKLSTLGRFV